MNCTEVLGFRSRLTPPTSAASQWPWRMALKAFSRARRLEEQAVSMAVLGPTMQKHIIWILYFPQKCSTSGLIPKIRDVRCWSNKQNLTIEVKKVGNTIRKHGTLATSHAVSQQLLWISTKGLASLGAADTDIYSSLRATHRQGVYTWASPQKNRYSREIIINGFPGGVFWIGLHQHLHHSPHLHQRWLHMRFLAWVGAEDP